MNYMLKYFRDHEFESVVEKWKQTGLLDQLPTIYEQELTSLYEDAAAYIINNEKNHIHINEFANYIFPLIRRIFVSLRGLNYVDEYTFKFYNSDKYLIEFKSGFETYMNELYYMMTSMSDIKTAFQYIDFEMEYIQLVSKNHTNKIINKIDNEL